MTRYIRLTTPHQIVLYQVRSHHITSNQVTPHQNLITPVTSVHARSNKVTPFQSRRNNSSAKSDLNDRLKLRPRLAPVTFLQVIVADMSLGERKVK